MNNKKCLHCKEVMQKGLINTPATPIWTPEGKMPLFSGKKFSTYVCTKCGYMESRLDLEK